MVAITIQSTDERQLRRRASQFRDTGFRIAAIDRC